MRYPARTIASPSIAVLAFLSVVGGGFGLPGAWASAQDRDKTTPFAYSPPDVVVHTAADRERLGAEALNKWIDEHRNCPGVTAEDIAEFHRRLDAGETVAWRLRFVLGSTGYISKVYVDQGSGLQTIDRSLDPDVCRVFFYDEPLSRGFRQLEDLGADVAISRRSVSFRLYGQGSTLHDAEQVERLERSEWTERFKKAKFPQQHRYLELFRISRQGREVSLSAELDWYTVRGHL
jgi:hypothetical protein